MKPASQTPDPGTIFTSRTARFGRLEVEHFRATPGLELRAHAHRSVHYCLPLRGCFYESAAGSGEVLLEAGWLRTSPAGDRHRIRFGPQPAECLLVFEPSETGRPVPGGRRYLPLERAPGLARVILRELDRRDPASALIVETAVVELATQSSRPRTAHRPPPWLLRVRERLEDAPLESRDLAALAAEAGVHRSQLVRAFRAHFGCSIGQHLRRCRLAAAVRQITAGDRPLAAIAADCGFSDQSHLSRRVRAFAGEPPARLRARARAGSPGLPAQPAATVAAQRATRSR